MRSGYFENWGLGMLALFAILLGLAVVATNFALKSQETTGAHCEFTFNKCQLDAPSGLTIDGFSPVLGCAFLRMDRIELGPGRIVVGENISHEANDVSFVLAHNRSSNVLRMAGNDLAIGKFSSCAGNIDVQCLGSDELRMSVLPYSSNTRSKGQLSMGSPCSLESIGYELFVDGEKVEQTAGSKLSAVFHPLGGVGRFSDNGGGFGLQFKIVDRDFDFAKPLSISGIQFLNENSHCAGVSSGSIHIGQDKDATIVPLDSCVRLEADEFILRHLGLKTSASELDIALSGQFHSVQLNGIGLVAYPLWLALFIGFFIFLIFWALIYGARKLAATNKVT